jgi:McKusick-Kaufman syndrome protein
MASNKISVVLQPLDSSDFVSTLRSFCRILQSSVGPEGGIKVLISAAGYTTFSSSSSRLMNNITLSNPICGFIKQIMQSQINAFSDHGLYTGILITSLLEKILSRNIGLSVPAAANVIEHLSSILLSLFDLSCIKMEVDLSTVKQLLSLVKSVLSSKATCRLTRANVQNLQLSIVKGFLQTTIETFGDIIVECTVASEMKSHVFPGILYQINYRDISTVLYDKCNKKGYISLLLFNVMLTGDETSKISENRSIQLESSKNCNYFVEEAVKLFEQYVKLNVDVVACQKVVHPTLHLYLRRKGILLLDRMGTDLTHAVEKLTGATPISSIKDCLQDPDDLHSLLGTVETVQIVECGQKYYVSLEKSGSNIATLIAHAQNEEAAIELKVRN